MDGPGASGRTKDQGRSTEDSRASAIPIHDLVRLMDPLPFALLFGGGGLVPLARFECGFACQPPVVLQPVGVQTSRLDGFDDGAAGLGAVGAVGEATLARERGDVVERSVESRLVGPEL